VTVGREKIAIGSGITPTGRRNWRNNLKPNELALDKRDILALFLSANQVVHQTNETDS
jgi:hypothetical protein